jgi:hypothetical protein
VLERKIDDELEGHHPLAASEWRRARHRIERGRECDQFA